MAQSIVALTSKPIGTGTPFFPSSFEKVRTQTIISEHKHIISILYIYIVDNLLSVNQD